MQIIRFLVYLLSGLFCLGFAKYAPMTFVPLFLWGGSGLFLVAVYQLMHSAYRLFDRRKMRQTAERATWTAVQVSGRE